MSEVSTIGLDIAKHVFQAHGPDASGRVVFRGPAGRRIGDSRQHGRCLRPRSLPGGAVVMAADASLAHLVLDARASALLLDAERCCGPAPSRPSSTQWAGHDAARLCHAMDG